MIPKEWAFPPPLLSSSPGPGFLLGPWSCHPQQRVSLTELMRAGAMVVLMWSTAFRTPEERQRGQAGSGQEGPEGKVGVGGGEGKKRLGDWCEVRI